MLRHPLYAEAYCYGRSRTDLRRKVPGQLLTGWVRLPPEEWAVLLRDTFPAYIPWDQYLANGEQLRRNPSSFASPGVPRAGSALLGGLVACERCGWKMCMSYRGRPEAPQYVCHRNDPPCPNRPRCPSVSSRGVDAVVGRLVLQALAPATVALSLSAADDLKREGDRLDHQWRTQLERAEYQTALARRRYEAAEPENRLVARELERQWEEAMRAEQRLREEYARVRPRPVGELTAADRARIAAAVADIPGLWASAGAADRQALVRHLVERVEIAATENSEVPRLTVGWVGGDISQHEVIRPVGRYGQLERLPQLLTRLRELMAAGTRSGEIAARLNAEGFRSPRGDQRFTADRIRQIVGRLPPTHRAEPPNHSQKSARPLNGPEGRSAPGSRCRERGHRSRRTPDVSRRVRHRRGNVAFPPPPGGTPRHISLPGTARRTAADGWQL